jgi:hypothetical protein
MIEWFTFLVIAVTVVVGGVQLVEGARAHPPRDVSVIGSIVVVALLLTQVVVAVVAPSLGSPITGDPLEFWMYLITAILVTPVALVFAFVDRTRIGTLALAGGSLATTVMVVRMADIWTGL